MALLTDLVIEAIPEQQHRSLSMVYYNMMLLSSILIFKNRSHCKAPHVFTVNQY